MSTKKKPPNKIKIPKEFQITRKQCKARTNERGLLASLPQIASTISNPHYSLQCLINNNKPISLYNTNVYYYCSNYLVNNVKLQILADKVKVKTILVKKDKQNVSILICYLNTKYEQTAYLCAFINKTILDATQEEQIRIYSFNQPYNYLLGELYGYTPKEIRGYYLNRYILKSLPPKIKSKMMKYITESNFDLNFVSHKTKLERLYNALKKVDNFADFDSKYLPMKDRSDKLKQDIINSKKYKAFVKLTKPQPFVFHISELQKTFPDDYNKLKPILTKFQKSLSK